MVFHPMAAGYLGMTSAVLYLSGVPFFYFTGIVYGWLGWNRRLGP